MKKGLRIILVRSSTPKGGTAMRRPSSAAVMCLIVAGFAFQGHALAEKGAAPQSPLSSPSGKSSDFDKKTETGRHDPHSGTVIPDTNQSASNALEQPAGIGEKGSGQTQSTIERSGGPQPSASESTAKSSKQHGEGKTEKAAKDLHSQKPHNK
jgi:hypothetical protein